MAATVRRLCLSWGTLAFEGASLMGTVCYFCGAPATSKEHVPPKSIFPEAKDVQNGKDYRANLITVPSCDAHNSAKSTDDAYLMMVIVSYFQNNDAARNQIKSKVTRAWTKDKKLAGTIVKNLRTVPLGGSLHHAFEVDTDRLDRSLELAAHGLHFHQFGVGPPNPYRVISYPLAKLEGEEANDVNTGRADILRMAGELFNGQPVQGANPEIFWYQLSPETEGRHVLRMCFYEAFTVIALSSPGTVAPPESAEAAGAPAT